jgi:hypothetical protein
MGLGIALIDGAEEPKERRAIGSDRSAVIFVRGAMVNEEGAASGAPTTGVGWC